jgi:hypothetical protein
MDATTKNFIHAQEKWMEETHRVIEGNSLEIFYLEKQIEINYKRIHLLHEQNNFWKQALDACADRIDTATAEG